MSRSSTQPRALWPVHLPSASKVTKSSGKGRIFVATVTGIQDTDQAAAISVASQRTDSLMGDTQDRFLTLLVTQLRNQDPLNPMDNAEVTSQIAQLSTVNGINQLDETLLALSGQMDVSQSMQAANLIGKGVLVPGGKVALGSHPEDDSLKVATPFGVDVIAPAENVKEIGRA